MSAQSKKENTMAIVSKSSNESANSITESVADYDISIHLGRFFPFSYQETFQTFRALINDKGNGIPGDIRSKLADIYTQTGESLANNHMAFRAFYSIKDIEDEIEYILTDDYGVSEEEVDAVKKAAEIDEKKMRELLISAVNSVDASSAIGEIVSEVFSQSVSYDLAQHLHIKIKEGVLPMLESGDNGNFDMS